MTQPRVRQGLILIHTGQGKGKTTAALGLVFRALGQGLRVCVLQFIKSERGRWGETIMAERLGITWHALGRGFVFDPERRAQDAALATQGWELARECIASGAFDLVVLDEFTYPCKFGWLDASEVARWLAQERPSHVHVVITGRDAPPELIAIADLVTEMVNIRHPHDRGVAAQPGIEF
jgi:cob(I)alamin adenosyltransferase